MWLADQAKVRLADGERGLLARVSVITRWGGRYPLAFDLEDMRPSAEHDGPKHWSSGDTEALLSIYARSSERLSELCRVYGEHRTSRERERKLSLYAPALQQLQETCREVFREDGTTHFICEDDPPTSSRGGISCARCHLQFTLGDEVRGVLCRCGKLFVAAYRYDPPPDALDINTLMLDPPGNT